MVIIIQGNSTFYIFFLINGPFYHFLINCLFVIRCCRRAFNSIVIMWIDSFSWLFLRPDYGFFSTKCWIILMQFVCKHSEKKCKAVALVRSCLCLIVRSYCIFIFFRYKFLPELKFKSIDLFYISMEIRFFPSFMEHCYRFCFCFSSICQKRFKRFNFNKEKMSRGCGHDNNGKWSFH